MKRTVFIIGAALTLFGSSHAMAQETGGPSYFTQSVKAPRQALELSVGTGYTQGTGDVRSTAGNTVADYVGAGVAFDVGAGYRIDPRWQIAALGEYQELNAVGRATGGGARGTVFGIGAAYHIMPYDRVDPWLQLGTGYRLLWTNAQSGPTMLSHGFEIARLTVGCDIRTSPEVALGPMVGVDLTTFLFQSGPNVPNVVSDYGVSAFFFGGIQGRFDLAGKYESAPGTAIATK